MAETMVIFALSFALLFLMFALGRAAEGSILTKEHKAERRRLEEKLFRQCEINAKLLNELFNLRDENRILKECIKELKSHESDKEA